MKKHFLYIDPCNGAVIVEEKDQKAYLDWTLKNCIPTDLVLEGNLEKCQMKMVAMGLVIAGTMKGHYLYVGCN